jgi:hypothetical protein
MREALNRWLGVVRSKLFGGPYLLCSECFQDAGIRHEAAAQGLRFDDRACPNCHATNGKLLNREGVDSLQQQFFSSSTATHRYQIPVPVLGIGGSGDDQVEALRPETRSDWSLIKNVTGNSLFYRSPRLFYLGITNHFGKYGCLRKQAILDECCPSCGIELLDMPKRCTGSGLISRRNSNLMRANSTVRLFAAEDLVVLIIASCPYSMRPPASRSASMSAV